MNVVLLSGGSGQRLWPLSNDARSKQFLKVLEGNKGQDESMVQRVWNQLTTVGLNSSTLIATSKSQVDMIQNQLDSTVPIIVEPERRDTFPAIALAASYLYSKKNVSLNEVVAILPVDPFVEEYFFEKVKLLEDMLIATDSELALVGVKPTYPSTKYGYIIPKGTNSSYYSALNVSHFKEKPNVEEAKNLINQNALWNCGVFAFKLEYILNILVRNSFPVHYDELSKRYSELPKISFDFEVVEKASNIVVLPYEGYWRDLGTWNTLTEEMASNKIGKGIISVDSINTHLVNELDIPIVILGVSNVVVAASPDGILVTEKSASPRVKEIINFEQRPMFEERRWGWYKVLDCSKIGLQNEVLVKRVCIKAGNSLDYEYHHKKSEVWTIISGNGYVVIDDTMKEAKPGDVFSIPIEGKHAIKAITDMEYIEVQTGSEIFEEDCVCICNNWVEIEKLCSLV
ncbi:sugar phosphate nucleotidyltransferase [Paenibacillus sp. GYB004]|uniref:sugar phosphate nucleotidyltransferase n=1 Tax=Paenibacillus sp. GYB004 TaxID=2994393 RepID=UPI002F96C331